MTFYAARPETVLREAPRASARAVNHVLMGTRLEEAETDGAWVRVNTLGRGRSGWVHATDLRDRSILKVFFVDVGQGDGAIVESPTGSLLIDGGPSRGFHAFLRHRYRYLFRRGETVHFDALVVSHPDSDHFHGLTRVLRDRDFTFGTIFHNGIIRFRSAAREFDLGHTRTSTNGPPILRETFSTLTQARRLVDGGELMTQFRNFWRAALDAHAQGRLRGARRITQRDGELPGFSRDDEDELRIEVLGPVPTRQSGRVEYTTFPDPHDHPSQSPSSSHTRNGHSVVLKLVFGRHSFLFGGDLNIPAEHHLMSHYGDENPFRVDVAKACHHGSSDFSVSYLKQVRPRVNVVSSGDNKSFDHPTADAVGASARHARGDHPLLFSTELARAVSGQGEIHYGLINARSNGRQLVMAQMKEQRRRADVWDSFTVPWRGRFPHAD